jgi:hypothetical protein
MSLDGWTRVGDKVEATGRWVLYRHRATAMAKLEVLEELPRADAIKASKLYAKRADSIRRGGFWLVDPEGVVREATFVRH